MWEEFQFRHPYYLYLISLALPLAMLFYWLIERRRRQFLHFLGEPATIRAAQAVKHYRLRVGLLLAAAICGVIALARPQWGQYQDLVQAKGIDVIIAVDVSLSMLANDESPSRLARARRLCADLIERLHSHRVGLIAFAGNSAALMPLTLDTVALKTFVDALDSRAVDEPGTSVVQAIRRATQSFKSIGKQSRVLVIISDGEDQADEPLDSVRAAAYEAADNGVIILTVGVGTSVGSNIPLDEIGASGFKYDYDGNLVVTRLDETLLQVAAEVTQGLYLPVQPDGKETDLVVAFVDRLNKGEFRDRLTRDREERYQYPLAAALLLLMLDTLVALRRL
ncbi:MAG: VWA domain-containing protein [Acidobacteriota bacterium]